MKPYIHATIIFAGFVMAAGTTAIVTAEYKLVSTKGQVLVSMLDQVRSRNPDDRAPLVADRIVLRGDNNPFDNDLAGQLQSEVTPQAVYAPVVDIQSEPVRHAQRASHLTHFHRAEAKLSTPAAPANPANAVQPTPAISLVSLPKSGQKGLPAGFRFYYSSNGKTASFKVPGFNVKCMKDSVQFKFDRKALALQQKQWEAQLKTLPKDLTTFVEMTPEDQAKFKELGAMQAGRQFEENQTRSMHEADSARQIAFSNAQNALREAGVSQVTIGDADSGN
jgi:hypothetical protein